MRQKVNPNQEQQRTAEFVSNLHISPQQEELGGTCHNYWQLKPTTHSLSRAQIYLRMKGFVNLIEESVLVSVVVYKISKEHWQKQK